MQSNWIHRPNLKYAYLLKVLTAGIESVTKCKKTLLVFIKCFFACLKFHFPIKTLTFLFDQWLQLSVSGFSTSVFFCFFLQDYQQTIKCSTHAIFRLCWLFQLKTSLSKQKQKQIALIFTKETNLMEKWNYDDLIKKMKWTSLFLIFSFFGENLTRKNLQVNKTIYDWTNNFWSNFHTSMLKQLRK